MSESVYKVIEVVGTSPESWEKAASSAIMMATKTLRDVRIGEIVGMDVHLEDGKTLVYRAKMKISFRYHGDE